MTLFSASVLLSGEGTRINIDDATCEYCPQQKVLYGLPCAKCSTYYSADMTACPVCRFGERVPAHLAPTASKQE